MKGSSNEKFPKPIRLYSWRQQLADTLSAYALPFAYAAAIIVVLLDVFLWRA